MLPLVGGLVKDVEIGHMAAGQDQMVGGCVRDQALHALDVPEDGPGGFLFLRGGEGVAGLAVIDGGGDFQQAFVAGAFHIHPVVGVQCAVQGVGPDVVHVDLVYDAIGVALPLDLIHLHLRAAAEFGGDAHVQGVPADLHELTAGFGGGLHAGCPAAVDVDDVIFLVPLAGNGVVGVIEVHDPLEGGHALAAEMVGGVDVGVEVGEGFENVQLTAQLAVFVAVVFIGNVVVEEPEGRPVALGEGNLQADLKVAVGLGEQALAPQTCAAQVVIGGQVPLGQLGLFGIVHVLRDVLGEDQLTVGDADGIVLVKALLGLPFRHVFPLGGIQGIAGEVVEEFQAVGIVADLDGFRRGVGSGFLLAHIVRGSGDHEKGGDV